MDCYNPFPADPASPADPVFKAGGAQLNAIIQGLAAQFGGICVDNATPFVGHEAEYTYQDDQPAGSSISGPFGGMLPIGNLHPNDLGYVVIAADVAAASAVSVPEPSTGPLMAFGFLMAGLIAHRRIKGNSLV